MLTLKLAPYFPYMSYLDEMSEEMSIFQSAEMERCYFVNSLVYSIPKRMIPQTISVFDDDNIVLIIPALLNASKLELAGHANGMCELSPIYFKGTTENNLKYYFKYFLDTTGYSEYNFTKIRESTQLSHIISDGIVGYDISAISKENVFIDFFDGHDEWFNSLSKNVRQNIRTAYNRLEKDGKEIRIEVYHGKQMSHTFMNRLLDIYIKRHNERYGVKTSIMKSIYLRYLDFSTRALLSNPMAFHVCINISGRIAAFCSGYIDHNSFVVPRLSIDNDFLRYSPGLLLINEMIKKLDTSRSGICVMDLSEGAEKYKLDLGGTIYKKIDYTIRPIMS